MRIIINADDFGWDGETIAATIECFERGGLTSATIMATMPGSAEAIQYAREHPEFSFGAHLTFTSDGPERPLTPPSEIPGLVDDEGRFLPPVPMRLKAMRGSLPIEQIEREMSAQIGFLRDHGLSVSHVDSHGHVHKYRSVRLAMQRVLPRFGITRVRTVQDVYLRVPWRSPAYWLGGMWRSAIRRRFTTTDHFFMPTTAGDENWMEPLLSGRVLTSTNETLEVGVHPGRTEPWRDAERIACVRFAELARERTHAVVTWNDL